MSNLLKKATKWFTIEEMFVFTSKETNNLTISKWSVIKDDNVRACQTAMQGTRDQYFGAFEANWAVSSESIKKIEKRDFNSRRA